MSKSKLTKKQCNQTEMIQDTTIEPSLKLRSFYGSVTGMSESNSCFDSLPRQTYPRMANTMLSCQYSFPPHRVNTMNQYEFNDVFGQRRKRTECEIIIDLQKQVDQLKTEVTNLKHLQNSQVKIHYIEIVDVPFDEVKNQVLDFYNTHGENYPDDIAVKLRLDLKTVMKAVQELIHEGKLQLAI
ncbi:MAG: hypothetical protein WC406_10950 [Methanoregula sp.]|jgi:hypothetical protein|nr:hypothetical protein [Methanoregula sp.]